ncbi:MAG: GNAT family N-acetyltransferase [Tannerellaceae bacterium]|nr:GNAT family N-acetyltransferase [Tannerellaceae bacterium]
MESKKEKQIKQLWRDTFGDNEEFIKMYFKWVYKSKYALTLEDNGRIISSLMLLPYTLNYYGTELPIGYIAGACTLADERGKGWMTRLMSLAFAEMKRRGMALATLIPASAGLFDFYDRYGFVRAFEYSFSIHTRAELAAPTGSCIARPMDKLDRRAFAYSDRKLRERPVCVLHNRADMNNIMRDMSLAGGRAFVAVRGDALCGMAFATPVARPASGSDERSALVREILFEDDEARAALVFAIAETMPVDRIVCRIPCTAASTPYSYGMARVIDADRMIALRRAACGAEAAGAETEGMDVKLLTSILLDYPDRRAHMSLMLD